MVEFALIAPIFFVFVFGIVEAALIVNSQVTLDSATREAARIGALCGGAIGSWTSPAGTSYSNGVQGSPCPQAIDQTVREYTGILRVTGTNPTVAAVAPAAGSSSFCNASSSQYPYYAPLGCDIQVTVTYNYQYLLNFLVGPSAPSVTMQSSATTVSQ